MYLQSRYHYIFVTRRLILFCHAWRSLGVLMVYGRRLIDARPCVATCILPDLWSLTSGPFSNAERSRYRVMLSGFSQPNWLTVRFMFIIDFQTLNSLLPTHYFFLLSSVHSVSGGADDAGFCNWPTFALLFLMLLNVSFFVTGNLLKFLFTSRYNQRYLLVWRQ
jgi:hypothetical protein